MLLSHSLLPWVSGTLGKEGKQRKQTHHPPPPKEQRACGINQNAKHNNKVPWESEPCDCVPACTPLRDGGRGAHLTAAGGSFLSHSHLPSRCHQSIHYSENWLTFVGRRGKRGRAEGRRQGARAGDAGPRGVASPGTGWLFYSWGPWWRIAERAGTAPRGPVSGAKLKLTRLFWHFGKDCNLL